MKRYTVKEVAESIGVNEITVKRRIKEGSLKAYKEKNKLFISEGDLNVFLETHPRYSRKVQHHQSEQDAVVDVISANEAFNTYAVYLKKLMALPKEDINSILPIVENHKSLLDLCINELKKKNK
jgi:excisionase family DNA binding protein